MKPATTILALLPAATVLATPTPKSEWCKSTPELTCRPSPERPMADLVARLVLNVGGIPDWFWPPNPPVMGPVSQTTSPVARDVKKTAPPFHNGPVVGDGVGQRHFQTQEEEEEGEATPVKRMYEDMLDAFKLARDKLVAEGRRAWLRV